jgi:uncharacterized damage-inducible protein DinB
MNIRVYTAVLATALVPSLTLAQSSPVAQAFRNDAMQNEKKLVAAAETMPADKYGFKPTPPQMSFGEVVAHLAGGNDLFCGTLTGMKPPTRTKVAPTDSKDVLVARLKETFQFCDQALSKLDDSNLAEELPMFGSKMSRAAVMTMVTADWADHYSQAAIYLRLNGELPPTAKKP